MLRSSEDVGEKDVASVKNVNGYTNVTKAENTRHEISAALARTVTVRAV